MNRPTPKEMADAFANWCNGADRDDYVEFASQLCHYTHRTLQQCAFGVMLECIRKWAGDSCTDNFDLRNEATVKLSEKIFRQFGSSDFYLPLI